MKDVNILTSNGVNVQKALELFGDMETYDETLGTFLVEVEEKKEKLKSYKEVADMANYAIYAHSLKSDAKYFGFEKLAEMAYQHELESKANNMYYVYENYDNLINETNRIILVANQYMGKVPLSTPVSAQVNAPAATIQGTDVSGPVFNDPAPVTSSQVNSKKKLLIVDDSNIIRDLVQNFFKDNFEVLSANDGQEAISIVENNESELVGMLLDLMMPNVDGFSVLDFFKERDLFSKIPVSIITGVDKKDEINKAFTYPIIDMLQKPFNEQNIRAIVEKTINSRVGV